MPKQFEESKEMIGHVFPKQKRLNSKKKSIRKQVVRANRKYAMFCLTPADGCTWSRLVCVVGRTMRRLRLRTR